MPYAQDLDDGTGEGGGTAARAAARKRRANDTEEGENQFRRGGAGGGGRRRKAADEDEDGMPREKRKVGRPKGSGKNQRAAAEAAAQAERERSGLCGAHGGQNLGATVGLESETSPSFPSVIRLGGVWSRGGERRGMKTGRARWRGAWWLG